MSDISFYAVEKAFFNSLYPSLDGAAERILKNISCFNNIDYYYLSISDKKQLVFYLNTLGYFSLRRALTTLQKHLHVSRTFLYTCINTNIVGVSSD